MGESAFKNKGKNEKLLLTILTISLVSANWLMKWNRKVEENRNSYSEPDENRRKDSRVPTVSSCQGQTSDRDLFFKFGKNCKHRANVR